MRVADVARTAERTDTVNRLQLPALFFRTTYRSPITGRDVPLPLHNWVMAPVGSGSTGARSGDLSDRDGVSSLLPLREDHGDFSSWEFLWQGRFPDGGLYPPTRDSAVWVDLDTNDWVVPDDVQRIEKRKLLRLQNWRSTFKAGVGGFFEAFNDEFEATGVLRGADLAAARLSFGSRASALDVKIDHGLFRSYLAFTFYNLPKKRTMNVPPGLVVDALDDQNVRVGSGTAISENGTVFVLHWRPPPLLRHVALLLKPRYKLTRSITGEPAHVRVELHPDKSTAQSSLQLPPEERPPVLIVKLSEAGGALLRHALGVPTVLIGPILNAGYLTSTELEPTGIVAGFKRLLHEAGDVPRTIRDAS